MLYWPSLVFTPLGSIFQCNDAFGSPENDDSLQGGFCLGSLWNVSKHLVKMRRHLGSLFNYQWSVITFIFKVSSSFGLPGERFGQSWKGIHTLRPSFSQRHTISWILVVNCRLYIAFGLLCFYLYFILQLLPFNGTTGKFHPCWVLDSMNNFLVQSQGHSDEL